MKRHKVEVRSRLDLGKLTRKVLRLLRADVKSSVGQERFAHIAAPANIYHDSWREIRSASLNAERQKAEALMEWQKHRFIR